ncbi:DUF935 family protein [Chitinophaga agrisoli]|uniref:DUF935 family protein n=1 Tax=Chitinophaga agrisoli TaxID=2607653 RepID=A0A5B2W315_9BACT|nr:DUF935 family protein [Chitinophaga agrisoli]KAA2245504.1 DUF935 family protein [Chitinophaga agrisoli]
MAKQSRITKKTGNVEGGVMIQNITVRPVVRQSQDIQKWRSSLKAAEGIVPNRVMLYDMYADILLDGTLRSVVSKRINGVTKTQLIGMDSNGKEVEAMTKLASRSQFRHLRKEARKHLFWGGSVLELGRKGDDITVWSAPRKNVRFDIGRITFEQSGWEGYDYREPPYSNYVFECGDRDDLGLLLSAAQYVIYKRGGFGDWAQFAEVFGMPFREARYDGYNEQVRKQLETALNEAGSASYAILPKDAEFKLHETRNASGNGNLYDQLRKACNEEICINILGQTETTTSSASSGYAQSKTHADVEESILEDDRQDELAILNEKVLPILINLGFPFDGCSFAYKMQQEKLSKKEKADIAIKLKKDAKLPIGDDYFYEEFGIPKPDDYDAQKKAMEESSNPFAPDNSEPDDEEDGEEAPPRKTPTKAKKEGRKGKLSFWDRMRLKLADFFDLAPAEY